MIRLITRIAAAVIAFGFAVDATYAIYNGAALNSAGIVLDFVLGTMVALMGLFIPMFFSNDTADEFDIIDNPVAPTPQPECPDCRDNHQVYEMIDAIRLLSSHKCVTEQHISVLGDIAKCIVTQGANHTCDV